MPYELLTKVGLPTGILIILAFFIYSFVKIYSKEKSDNKDFIQKVMDRHEEREERLLNQIGKYDTQLDNYNRSLQDIANSIKVIPTLQQDVAVLKEKIK